jgi:hypothetical protein
MNSGHSSAPGKPRHGASDAETGPTWREKLLPNLFGRHPYSNSSIIGYGVLCCMVGELIGRYLPWHGWL